MADQTSGIDLMRRRIERASRQPPPAPRVRTTTAEGAPSAAEPPGGAPAQAPGVAAGKGEAAAPVSPAPARARRRAAVPRAPERPRLAADLPPVNLAIRVRKPLDDHLADLIHELRRAGVRTSKVELIEMLLWEQAGEDAAALHPRLAAFRAAAPRGASAPL